MLVAICREAQILTEERQHMILEPIGDCAGVRARVDLKAVCDSVVIQNGMQLPGVDAQAILVAHVHSDGAVLFEIADVLIDKGQR